MNWHYFHIYKLFIILTCSQGIVTCDAVSSVQFFIESNITSSLLQMYSDEQKNVTVNLFSSSNQSIYLRFVSSDLRVATVEQNSSIIRNRWTVNHDGNYTMEMKIIVVGVRLGKTIIGLETRKNHSIEWQPNSEHKLVIIFLRRTDFKDTIFLVFTILFVISITTIIGTTLDFETLRTMIQKPIGSIAGLISQFILMPNLAIAIAKISNMSPAFGLGLLTTGCSGGGDNSWTVLLKGDINLSLTLNFLSNLLSLGMMPLWLFVYGRFFIDVSSVKIPFDQIVYNCLGVLIPSVIGMLINRKFPKVAAKMRLFLKPLIILLIVFILTFGTWVNLYLYKLMGEYPSVILVSTCFPWLGYVFGYLIALAFRLNRAQCVTITLVTGIQNVGIPIVVLLYSMPKPEGDLGAIVPVILALTGAIPLYIWLLVQILYEKYFKKKKTIISEFDNFSSNVQSSTNSTEAIYI